MKKKDLLHSLEFILNKGFCARTIHRAWIEFDKIKSHLAEKDRELIYKWMLEMDPDYPDYLPNYDYGREQFAFSVKQAMHHIREDEI